MKTFSLAVLSGAMALLGWSEPCRAGTCFLWCEDGASDCCSGIMSEAACESLRTAGHWDHVHFIANDSSGCRGILPWEDADGDTVWRYVVVVRCGPEADPSRCDTGRFAECWESHTLYRSKNLWSKPGM